MRTYDFIIVGLGTAGSATCMNLARRGYRVLGLDQYTPPHTLGSHHGLSRSVRRAYPEGHSYVPMALKSWELWRQLEKDQGLQLLVKTGNLTLGPPDCPALSGFLRSAQAHEIPHQYLDAREIRRYWPQLSPPDGYYAGLEEEAGIVFPEKSITAFLHEADKAGADLLFGERVDNWAEQSSSVSIRTADNTYEAGRILIASGAWSKKLLMLQSNVLHPTRVAVHWLEAPADESLYLGRFPVNFWQVPAVNDPKFPDGYKEFYSLPLVEPGGQIKIAFHNGLSECDPDTMPREVYLEEIESIKEVISDFLPGLAGCPLQSNTCFYTLTPDNDFYLGRRPGSAHVFGAALAGHGFKFAPVIGELLADLMLDLPASMDISMFSPDRFEQPYPTL